MTTPPNQGPQYHPPGPKPDNHLVIAILSTLFCCLPLGVVSIVNAVKVDSAFASGNYYEAVAHSEAAKKWAIWSALIFVPLFILGFIFSIVTNSAGR